MSLSRFFSDTLWDSLVTHSLPVRPFNFRGCGNASRRCVRACIYASVHAWLPRAVYMHSLLDLHLGLILNSMFKFTIVCISQLFSNLIVIFKAMGRYCEPASCWSNDNKLKNLQKYPWMRDVTWVKFPTNSTMRATWKKLLWRQDKFEIMARLRLWSLHFDKEQLQYDEHAVGFPKYIYWNNYGLVLNPRKSGAVEKRAQAEAAVASLTCCKPGRRAGGCR